MRNDPERSAISLDSPRDNAAVKEGALTRGDADIGSACEDMESTTSASGTAIGEESAG